VVNGMPYLALGVYGFLTQTTLFMDAGRSTYNTEHEVAP